MKTKKKKETLKSMRLKAKLSLSQLANKAGVSRSTIVRAERDNHFSTVPLIAIAHRISLGLPAQAPAP